MSAPVRIQRRRTKGWRMPAGAVYVGRPSRFGNPFRVGECHPCVWDARHDGAHVPITAEDAVYLYGVWEVTTFELLNDPPIRELRGHDLVCWCPTCPEHATGRPLGVACSDCTPCHADVQLELANA